MTRGSSGIDRSSSREPEERCNKFYIPNNFVMPIITLTTAAILAVTGSGLYNTMYQNPRIQKIGNKAISKIEQVQTQINNRSDNLENKITNPFHNDPVTVYLAICPGEKSQKTTFTEHYVSLEDGSRITYHDFADAYIKSVLTPGHYSGNKQDVFKVTNLILNYANLFDESLDASIVSEIKDKYNIEKSQL